MTRSRYAFLSSLLAPCAVALMAVAPLSLWAQTSSSYFMLQGPLGPSGAYVTEKFRVEYTGTLQLTGFSSDAQNSGLTLVAAIFGNGSMAPSGTYTNSVGTVEAGGGFLSGFQLSGGGMVYGGAWPTGPQWGYFAAGGTYVNTFADPVINGVYEPGLWTEAKTGMATRYLTNGSFDAWSYGLMTDTGMDDEWGFDIYAFASPVGVQPTLADFSGPSYMETLVSGTGLPYSVYRITAVPEPGRAVLFLAGAVAMVVRRSRRSLVSCMA
jgi:hypothetical protein